MSTRCQVRFLEAGLPWNNEDHFPIMLYHHSDGYPTNMLKLLLDGYDKAIAPLKLGGGFYDKSWQAGRSGKAAAYTIAADPGGFEPEAGNEFHVDIEWFYEVVCVNHANAGGPPSWQLRVFTPAPGFWDSPDRQHLALVDEGNIVDLAKRAQEVEDSRESALFGFNPEKAERKTPTIAKLVERFIRMREKAGELEFHADDLRSYVDSKLANKTPASPDRILRDLRADSKINYIVLNRRESLYKIVPVGEAIQQAV